MITLTHFPLQSDQNSGVNIKFAAGFFDQLYGKTAEVNLASERLFRLIWLTEKATREDGKRPRFPSSRVELLLT